MDRPTPEPPEGYRITSKTVQLRGGRTQEISYFERIPAEPDENPEVLSLAEQVAESLTTAFAYLLEADELDDDEASNIYTYALNEGVPMEVIDECWQRALAISDSGQEGQ